MKIHRDQLLIRVCGTLLGAGFVAIGAFALLGAGEDLEAHVRGRAYGFGLTAIVCGVSAILVSLTVERLDNIWCAPPRKGLFRFTASSEPRKRR